MDIFYEGVVFIPNSGNIPTDIREFYRAISLSSLVLEILKKKRKLHERGIST